MKKTFLFLAAAALWAAACEKPVEEVPEEPLYPTEGAINARYSVDDHRTVVFAQGNLQYQPATGTWRFATHQYDFEGSGNDGIAPGYAGWIDLFGWGTSGYGGLMPYCIDDTAEHYGDTLRPLADIAHTFYDWGQNITVSNGGKKGSWRTLTSKEWEHLLSYRKGAKTKRGLATLTHIDGYGDIAGLVLLPDDWELPAGCSFQHGCDDGFGTNCYTDDQWTLMEQAGAVFLPAAGYRTGAHTSLAGEYGGYWTSNCYYLTTASDLYFHNLQFGLSATDRSNGQCVRLAQNK